MKKLKILIAVFCLTQGFSSIAHALPGYNGKILSIGAGTSPANVAFLKVERGRRTDVSDCATNANYSFAFATDTEQGQLFLSLALTAFASGVRVDITGHDQCTLASSIMDLRSIKINNYQ